MALISTTLKDDHFVFNAPDMEPLVLPLNPKIQENLKSQIKWVRNIFYDDNIVIILKYHQKLNFEISVHSPTKLDFN